GFAMAAQQSGLRWPGVQAQEPVVAQGGAQPNEGQKAVPKQGPKLQPLESLPRPDAPFKGQIDRIAGTSKPDFPKEIQPPKGAPNVLLVMTDDVGFGASSAFGGPIPTPTMDKLAKRGLAFNRFHTTALCSPTRAALITGRNHHSCASGVIMEQA